MRIELGLDILKFLKEKLLPFSLRAYDAVHLASALFVSEELNEECSFICSDKDIKKVAGALKIKIIDPEEV